ncbi:MAG TPA: phosphoenolpyruvate--protein phosphotransferase [Gemmatimonadota bacterium]|nr:phosphoenolpyruvate--protein phosphotransferase [Gemmatimonadota bacterium]
MSRRIQGIGASAGRVAGPVHFVRLELPPVPHRTISADEVDSELERFEEARGWAIRRTRELAESTRERMGDVEAQIFEPQALMLEDPELVEGTREYIRENFLSAERAFDWRLLEVRSRFLDSAHAMVMDRLSDLQDIRFRLLSRLQRGSDAMPWEDGAEPAVLAFEELVPSIASRLEPDAVLGILTASGSRASHSAVLARSVGIPTVVGLRERLDEIEEGGLVLLDGSTGWVMVDPAEEEIESFRRLVTGDADRRARREALARRPAVTEDGVRITLRANLDQPDEAEEAAGVRPEGVGLFRSEFLVIGRRTIPTEEEQYRAYRKVVRAFPDHPVTLRTFDIGGDKFPIFLDAPSEVNPYLGWRAIRVCLDRPELFRNQLRAAVRAGAEGRLRILLPFVVSVEEVRRTREILRDVCDSLEVPEERRGIPLGVMVETPAAAEIVDLIAPHVDFLSLGTNDLTQYVLAVDRGAAHLADRYEPLHPALMRAYRRLRARADEHGLELSVCGDLATDPVGFAALLGLGYRTFSLPPYVFPDVREWVGAVSVGELEAIAARTESSETAGEVRMPFQRYMEASVPAYAVPTGWLARL